MGGRGLGIAAVAPVARRLAYRFVGRVPRVGNAGLGLDFGLGVEVVHGMASQVCGPVKHGSHGPRPGLSGFPDGPARLT